MSEITPEIQQQLEKKIKAVKHPSINHTLFDLGILKTITFSENMVNVIFAFPFPNIPIADQLINSICDPIKESGLTCTVETTIMGPEEKQQFLQMEQSAWTG